MHGAVHIDRKHVLSRIGPALLTCSSKHRERESTALHPGDRGRTTSQREGGKTESARASVPACVPSRRSGDLCDRVDLFAQDLDTQVAGAHHQAAYEGDAEPIFRLRREHARESVCTFTVVQAPGYHSTHEIAHDARHRKCKQAHPCRRKNDQKRCSNARSRRHAFALQAEILAAPQDTGGSYLSPPRRSKSQTTLQKANRSKPLTT